MVAEAAQRYGGIDVLVNNAGVLQLRAADPRAALEEYRRVVEINQFGTFLGMHTVIPPCCGGVAARS